VCFTNSEFRHHSVLLTGCFADFLFYQLSALYIFNFSFLLFLQPQIILGMNEVKKPSITEKVRLFGTAQPVMPLVNVGAYPNYDPEMLSLPNPTVI
jgi:hypothetical protein